MTIVKKHMNMQYHYSMYIKQATKQKMQKINKLIIDTKYDYTAMLVNMHTVMTAPSCVQCEIDALFTSSIKCMDITNSILSVHTPHSLSVQMSGPVSLVHMQHSLSVQISGSAVYPPPHTLQLLAAVLVCLVLA